MADHDKEPMVAEPMETEPPVEIEVTEGVIYDSAVELVQLQEEIIWLEARSAILSTRCAGLTPEVLFTDFVDLDVALAGHTIAMPICRGIFKGKNQAKCRSFPGLMTANDRFQDLIICLELN
eukprot:6420993-Ditylum_brightwellii.AAC.1